MAQLCWISYLQLPSLQFPFSDLSFDETLSQYAVQLRLLDLFPSPHVALQVDQVPHAENSAGPYINFEYFSTIMKWTIFWLIFTQLTVTLITGSSVGFIACINVFTIIITVTTSCFFAVATRLTTTWPGTPRWEFWRTFKRLSCKSQILFNEKLTITVIANSSFRFIIRADTLTVIITISAFCFLSVATCFATTWPGTP